MSTIRYQKKTETAIVQYSMLLMMMDGQKIAAKTEVHNIETAIVQY